MGTELLNEPGDSFWIHRKWAGPDLGTIITFGCHRDFVEVPKSAIPKPLLNVIEAIGYSINRGFSIHAGDCRCNICINAPAGLPSEEPPHILELTSELEVPNWIEEDDE